MEHWVYFFWLVKKYSEKVLFFRLSVSVILANGTRISIYLDFREVKVFCRLITDPIFSRNRHKKYWCSLQDIEIESFIWFDYDYEERTSYHDIIILKLKSPALILNDKVQPVRLPPSRFFAEHSIDDCIISGWGAPEPGTMFFRTKNK